MIDPVECPSGRERYRSKMAAAIRAPGGGKVRAKDVKYCKACDGWHIT